MPSPELGTLRVTVVDTVVGDAACAARAVQTIDAAGPDAWEIALDLAIGWGVLPSFRARVDEKRLPASVAARLRSTSLAVTVRSTFVIHRSAEALRILDAAGVESVTVKGVGLIAALRRNPGSRATSDLDVVVREADAQRAREILIEAGYVEINPAFEHHMWEIAASRQLHNFARALRRDDFEVDLHWRFGPHPPAALDADRLIARAIAAPLAGRTIRVADPVDATLINVHHALRGSFIPHNTVRDLCDLKLWWESGALDGRLDELLASAAGSGLGPSLAALWGAILSRDPEHPVRAGSERLSALLTEQERGDAALLTRYFEEQLRAGAPAHFTLEVFAPGLYLRSLVDGFSRSMKRTPRAHVLSADGAAQAERRPLLKRLAGLPPRIARVVRDLVRLRAFSSYRAVARAQSRFH
jgi:putative nucleotidyltransferase-like protein